MTSTWVLVPAPAGRLDELRECLTSLGHPVYRTVVVTTNPEPVKLVDVRDLAAKVIKDPAEGINLSRWWNLGLDHIASKACGEPHEVLVTSSDCYGSAQGVADLAAALREHGLTMAGPDWHGRVPAGQPEVYHGVADRRTVAHRLPGACFMLAAEFGLRADEAMRWWYADDHLEMTARERGPVGLLGGIDLHHKGDHMLSAEQAQWAEEDRAKFVATWNREPW